MAIATSTSTIVKPLAVKAVLLCMAAAGVHLQAHIVADRERAFSDGAQVHKQVLDVFVCVGDHEDAAVGLK